jgi:hypothetical protein
VVGPWSLRLAPPVPKLPLFAYRRPRQYGKRVIPFTSLRTRAIRCSKARTSIGHGRALICTSNSCCRPVEPVGNPGSSRSKPACNQIGSMPIPDAQLKNPRRLSERVWPPVSTLRAALRQLGNEPSTVAIELHRQQIDLINSLASEMRQRTFEPQLAKRGNKTRFQHGSFRHGSSGCPVKMRRPGCRLLSQPRLSSDSRDDVEWMKLCRTCSNVAIESGLTSLL